MVQHRPPVGSTPIARNLRGAPTEAEKALWSLLGSNFPEAHFRRQVPIRAFFADFASHRAKLVIEADGGQHSDEADAMRTKLIKAEGYRVLRFWNNDILTNPEGVAAVIAEALERSGLYPPPLDGEGLGVG